VRSASLCMAYVIVRDDTLLVNATTEHCAIDSERRARRIPTEHRDVLAKLALDTAR